MVGKVTTDTDRWKVRNRNPQKLETSIDTDSDHVGLYGDHVWLAILRRIIISGRTVLIALIMEEEEEMIGRQYNGFEKLEPSA